MVKVPSQRSCTSQIVPRTVAALLRPRVRKRPWTEAKSWRLGRRRAREEAAQSQVLLAIEQDRAGRLAVAPEAQGRAYGERLMLEAEKVARAAGAKRINIDVFSELSTLVRWYQRFGYVVDDVRSIAVVPRPVASMHKQLAAAPARIDCGECTCE